jgi:hypothetical protein
LKKIKTAAIIFCCVVLAWLLLPELSGVAIILAVVAVKLFALAIILSFVAFLIWLIGPRALYRRYIAGYVRLRRMRRSQHLRQWREAAARSTTPE